jgi:hypothetical protein
MEKLIEEIMVDRVPEFNKFQLEYLVRKRLGQKDILDDSIRFKNGEPHLRFDMVGVNSRPPSSFVHNNKILHLFEDVGIFDNHEAVYLTSHKGLMSLNYTKKGVTRIRDDYGGWGTVEILVDILGLLTKQNSELERVRRLMDDLNTSKNLERLKKNSNK